MTPTTKKRKPPKNRQTMDQAIVLAALGVLILAVVVCIVLILANRKPSESKPIAATSPIPSNPFTPADFVWEGDYLTCLAGESRLGIDVSEHQGEIDWQQVADAGFTFAMVRLGYRGSTEGGLFPDAHALENLKNARAAGLDIGAYFYSQAISVQEAQAEARFCLSLLKGIKLDMPLVFDWEYTAESRNNGLDRRTLTDCVLAFCEKVEKGGYQAMVYFNPDVETRLHLEELLPYSFWLAMYSDTMDYPHQVDMWQYTDCGTVPGISERVDINILLPD